MYKPAEMIVDATEGLAKMITFQKVTPREQLAVKRIITLTATCLTTSAISAALNAKANGGDDDDILQAIWDAINPNSSTFCSIIITNKFRIPIGGPYRGLFKALWPAQVDGIPIPVPMWNIGMYFKNRLSPIPKTLFDLIKNQDYYHREIMTGEPIEKIFRELNMD